MSATFDTLHLMLNR